MNWGSAPVIATRTVAADAPTLNALVGDPVCQRRLVAGISPLLRPRVRPGASSNPRFVHAHVQLGRRDMLWITWLIAPGRGTTEVELAAQVESRGILTRLVLLGGRRRLHQRLEATLSDIVAAARHAAEDLDNVAMTTAPITPTPAQPPAKDAGMATFATTPAQAAT